jgi:lipopolysaccharide transport system ATP-binding protein
MKSPAHASAAVSAAVRCDNLSKAYPIYASPRQRLRDLFRWGKRKPQSEFQALKNVSFEVERGTIFGIVGENGAGKSTLLQLIAGILQPSEGTLYRSGRVSALLELGSGFNPEFTGRDNVFLNASILGLSRAEVESRYQDILDFAEIGDFITRPVKTYSSGMMMRLAFAVAINVSPEILLVDEALAVGDIYFRQRCMRKIHDMQRSGVTILYVTHSVADVKSLATKAVWLANGEVAELGDPDYVVTRYQAFMVNKDVDYLRHHRQPVPAATVPTPEPIPEPVPVAAQEQEAPTPAATEAAPAEEPVSDAASEAAPEPAEPPEEAPVMPVTTIPNVDYRYGTARAKILGIAAFDVAGEPLALLPPGEEIVVRITIRAEEEIEQPMVGFMLRNHLGVDFSGTNTALENADFPAMKSGEVATVDFRVHLPLLYPGHFSFSPAVASGTLEAYEMCDWIDNALTLQMQKRVEMYGYFRMPCEVRVRLGAG